MFLSNQKVLSAAFLGVLLGLHFHHTWSQERFLGRESYLVRQGQHFDRFLAVPHSTLGTIFGGLVAVAIVVGVYELIALGISKLFGNSSGPNKIPPGATSPGA